jgi:endonuclease/exonuclease/phosphatase family metal-dependent hydrolase
VNAESGLRRSLRRVLIACAIAYPLALFACALGFYCIGEDWWVTAAGLYAPRLVFLLPLPLTVTSLLMLGERRLLWTQVVAAFIAIVPLMGFVLPLPHAKVSSRPTLRVLTFNVDSVRAGPAEIAAAIAKNAPDVALLQEIMQVRGNAELIAALHTSFPYVEASTQFIIASRYPVVARTLPHRLFFHGKTSFSQFVRYLVETPLGELAIYNVHPRSPRGVLHVRTFHAVMPELESGQLLAGDPSADVRANAELRELQIHEAASSAARESLPTIVAGDTNLPGLSAIFRRNLSLFADGFREASWGFGYTFPVNHPFLRLDRILANDKLRFVSFRIDCRGASDHYCLVAEVQARQ